MNIKTNDYVSSTQVIDSQSYTTPSVQSSSSDGVSFRDELESMQTQKSDTSDSSKDVDAAKESEKTQDTSKSAENKTEQDKSVEKNDSSNTQKSADEVQKQQKTAESKDSKKASDLKNAQKADAEETLSTLKALNSKTEALMAIKANQNLSNNSTNKTSKKISGINSEKKSLKMDLNDAKFFVNLVHNEQFSVQNNPNIQNNIDTSSNTAILKSEASQQAVDVSSVLMTQLQASMETNKPFRIDFDNNVAVIMKVDKEGKLSANFIPGDQAVEAFLKANIPALQQSFDSQNLPYNNLSYSHAKQDNQRENDNKRNKENDDE